MSSQTAPRTIFPAMRYRDAPAAIDWTGYGSRELTARDPDGNVWSFGTYQPWASSPSGEPQASSVGDGGGTL